MDLELPAEGLVQQGFFEVVEGSEFGGRINTQLRNHNDSGLGVDLKTVIFKSAFKFLLNLCKSRPLSVASLRLFSSELLELIGVVFHQKTDGGFQLRTRMLSPVALDIAIFQFQQKQ